MPSLPHPMEEQFKDAARKIAILDSNLLLVWISGRMGIVGSNTTFKRIKSYTAEDARLLEWILSRFAGVVTTSGVLAEVSNLANALSGNLRDDWFRALAQFVMLTDEAHVGTQVVGAQPEFVRFGFTDAVLSHLSRSHVLITSEFRLAGYLQDQGKQALNFESLRLLSLSKHDARHFSR